MNLNITHGQVRIPTRCPSYIGLFPFDGVGKEQICFTNTVDVLRASILRKMTSIVSEWYIFMCHAKRLYFEPYNPISFAKQQIQIENDVANSKDFFRRGLEYLRIFTVVVENDFQMIIQGNILIVEKSQPVTMFILNIVRFLCCHSCGTG